MILYYSGCGNSLHVAKRLSELTGDKLVKISPNEEKPKIKIGGKETVGIVCPVYAWGVPRIVEQWVMRLETDRVPGYCYLAITCGDNVGKAPEKFANLIGKRGWELKAAFSFIMPETYINMPGFNLDSKENEKKKLEEVEKRLPWVADRIKNRIKMIDVERGKMAWINTYIINPLFYSLLITDKKFKVEQSCTGCGTCVNVCPLDNITIANGQPRWNGNCTNCMACYHHCPENAIQFGKATKGKGQYHL